MSVPTILKQHRALRWFVPACVTGVVGLAAGGVFNAQASSESLPAMGPAALLADVQSAAVTGFSGTIVAQMSLGLPDLPAIVGDVGGASMLSLLSGSHTLRFWYDGPERQRVALLGTTDETDLFHSGTELWQWDSNTHVATHSVLPAAAAHAVPRTPVTPALTPRQLAERAIAAIDPSTVVSVVANRRVAHRSAYELVLTPRNAATRVGSVRIAVDGATKMPLGVQVYPRGSSSPAIDISFSDITFKTPHADNFTFTPPPGATVKQGMQVEAGKPGPANTQRPPASVRPAPRHAAGADPVIIGSGWTAIAEYRTTPASITRAAGPLLSRLKAVEGPWGHGRVLDSALVSVLVTDDGRLFAGAVDPSALYTAAATHK